MEIQQFIEKDYQRIKSLLSNGGLFLPIQNEEKAIQNAVSHLENASRQLMEQQKNQIDQRFHVKMNAISALLSKLKMASNNIGVLNKDDINRLETALSEMLQILELQKKHELAENESEANAKKEANIADYKSRTEPALERHFEEAKERLDEINNQFEPLEHYYETASYDSKIWDDLQTTSSFPCCNNIRLGETVVQFPPIAGEDVSYKVPEIIPFFARKSLTITYKPAERQKLKSVVDNVFMRSLMSAEAGNIQYYLMDGANNGSLFFDYLKCDPRTMELFNGKLFVTSSDIEMVLVKLQQEYNEIDQNIRKGDSIELFNETHPKATIPYRVVIMDSFPTGVNPSYLPLIARLVKNEIAAGLHFVFLVEERDVAKLVDIMPLTTVYSIKQNLFVENDKDLSKRVLEHVSNAYNKEKTLLFEEYYDENVEWWKDTCANYTVIPLGMQRSDNYNLTFNAQGKGGGMSSANAIIVGTPGSGKSCMLHTMIVGSSIKYSPNELKFFLIDMKSVEFKQYELERLPHAEFVAINANPIFGEHVLQVICKRINERKRLLSQKKVTSYTQFRELYPNEVLPRYMIFIDEYHELLEGEIRQSVISNLDFIIREGRALGFNLILSSQSADVPQELINKISHRIAMRTPTSVARSVLDFYDERSPLLNNGQAIIHAETTDMVQCYYLPEDSKGKPLKAEKTRPDYLKMIREKWAEKTNGKYDHHLVVFDRELPALLNNNRSYKKMSVVKNSVEVQFSPGEKIMIDGNDFMCKFIRAKNENILVLGGRINVSVRSLNGCLTSMLPQLDPDQVRIDTVNLLDLSQADLCDEIEKSSNYIGQRFPKSTYMELGGDVNLLLDNVLEDIVVRAADLKTGKYVPPRFLVMYRTENEKGFEEIKTEINGTVISSEKSEMTKKLVQILELGPEVGVHSLIHFTDPASYFKVLDAAKKDRHYFNHRLLLQMNEESSLHFLDSYSRKDASELVDKNTDDEFAYNIALYYNAYDLIDPVRIKPYEFHINE
jgi:hypothetical protein